MKETKSILLVLALLAGTAAFAHGAPHPDQPHMETARKSLVAAKLELQHAMHNKGGHREQAIGFVNSAIVAVNRGIAYDRRHNHALLSTEFSSSPSVTPDQPHMGAALSNLENAKRNLAAATPDKGGYRKAALEYVDKAIDEVNKGIAVGI